jgi:hypothetical protein
MSRPRTLDQVQGQSAQAKADSTYAAGAKIVSCPDADCGGAGFVREVSGGLGVWGRCAACDADLVVGSNDFRKSIVDAQQLVDDPVRLERWSAFRDSTSEAVAYLIEPIMPNGSMGFEGAGKGAGKTWIGLAGAISVATGKPFLGRYPVRVPRTVVYIALEGQRSNLRDRVGALARGIGINPDSEALDRLVFMYKPKRIDLRDRDLAQQLVDEVLAVEPGLVVFDVLRRAALVRESGEGVGDFKEVLDNTDDLGRAGCVRWFEHHNTKPNDSTGKRDAGDRMSGSGALFGHSDFGIFITSTDRKNRVMSVSFYNRDDAELDDLTVRLVGEGSGRYGGFTYKDTCLVQTESDRDPEEQRVEHHDTAINTFLAANAGVSQRSIEEGVGGNAAEVRQRLKTLVAQGVIVMAKGDRNANLHWLATDPQAPRPETLDAVRRTGVGATASSASHPLRGDALRAPRPESSDAVETQWSDPVDYDRPPKRTKRKAIIKRDTEDGGF